MRVITHATRNTGRNSVTRQNLQTIGKVARVQARWMVQGFRRSMTRRAFILKNNGIRNVICVKVEEILEYGTDTRTFVYTARLRQGRSITSLDTSDPEKTKRKSFTLKFILKDCAYSNSYQNRADRQTVLVFFHLFLVYLFRSKSACHDDERSRPR